MLTTTGKVSIARQVADAERRSQKNAAAFNAQVEAAQTARAAGRKTTADGFGNIVERVGKASGNPTAHGSYYQNPVTRARYELEVAYRTSWIVRKTIDCVADDMVRAGIDLGADIKPEDADRLQRRIVKRGSWRQLNKAVKWGRLYGGAIVVPIIPKQNPATPLRLDTVDKGDFKGLAVFDRWQLTPSFGDLVTVNDDFESADEVGLPRFYTVMPGAPAMPGAKVHYSRAWRLTGPDLPYWQQITENLWDLSVLEPLFDRLVAFDSATQGASQLVYRAYLRTLRLKGLTDILGQDPSSPAYTALVNRITAIRDLQVSEGLTVIDADDDMQAMTYTFSGLSDMMLQFGQQISGSAGIPLVRLFGQSPTGLNSTGESDLRTYYDEVAKTQEDDFRLPVDKVIRLEAVNLGIKIDDDFWWTFKPLWQMTDAEKATVAGTNTSTVLSAFEGGVVVKRATILKELKQMSRSTGVWTNITDEEIEEAEEELPTNSQALSGVDPLTGEPAPGAMGPPEPTPGIDPGADEGEEQQGSGPAESAAGGLMGDLPENYTLHDGQRPKLRLVTRDAVPSRGYDVQGLPVFIETLRGERRNPKWPVLPADYGYIRCTGSAEGANEGLDVFVGPDHGSNLVWLVNQVDPNTGVFDEHKAILGFHDKSSAMQAYMLSYGDSAASRIGSVVPMDIDEFKDWLQSHPVSRAA